MNREKAIEELGFFIYKNEYCDWMMVDEDGNERYATIHERILWEEAMKDQYTAADMASAKADGFRDGATAALGIVDKCGMKEDVIYKEIVRKLLQGKEPGKEND